MHWGFLFGGYGFSSGKDMQIQLSKRLWEDRKEEDRRKRVHSASDVEAIALDIFRCLHPTQRNV